MITVGITGNVASGKSELSLAWRQAGIPVLSADEVARQVVEPGSEGLARVVAAFGPEVLAPDGSMDRARVRDLVFRDPEARARLEAIVHPRVREARDAWVRERDREGFSLVAAEIPLLYETGGEGEVDRVVLVDAPREERLRRLVEVRGLEPGEARRIMDAQMDPEAKRTRADRVVENAGNLDGLRAAAARALADLLPDEASPPTPSPDFSSRPPEGWMRVDLHLHTRASWDCLSDPEALLERARRRGVTRLAFTDHDTLPLALELHARYPEAVIPGEEVRTAEGIDLIGLYLSEEIPRGTPAREVIRRVREQGGITYLPHPYASGKGGGGRLAEELAPLVDVVEVFNARLHPAGARNDPARALAHRWGRLRGAGSDAHTVGEVAGAWVELPEHPNTPDGLRMALRRGRPAGREASRLVHLASTWAKVRKKLPGS